METDKNQVHKDQPTDDGVDVTLIRWMLSLSPRQRLVMLQKNIRSILRLRNARRGVPHLAVKRIEDLNNHI